MKKQVWKFPLRVGRLTGVDMPKDSVVLSVDVQGSEIFLWALVDPTMKDVEERHFNNVATGENFNHDSNSKFIGTSLLSGGALVYHTFEVKL